MEFYCLGSGSSGNSFVFKQNNECIMLECGFELSKLTKKLHQHNISLTEISLVAITHCHNDHCKAYGDLSDLGIRTIFAENCETPNFEIKCFPVCHDIKAYGYVIHNKITNENILFINDTSCCDINLTEKFDYIFIECNHIRTALKELIVNSTDEKRFKYERQLKYHLSLAGTKKMLKALDLENTKSIYLMHLSQEAGNQQIMKEQIEYEFKKPTYICGKDKDFI